MKKLLLILVVLCSLAAAGACSYAYFIYIPEKIEQKIISSFNILGFKHLTFKNIVKENGSITFSGISLDEKNFNTIEELSVHFSLLKFLLHPDSAEKIIIRRLSLTGEISRNLDITIPGWHSSEQLLQHFNYIPAAMVVIEDGTIDLLADDIGGVHVSYGGQISFSDSKHIGIKGYASSKQKHIGFNSKINGMLSSDGNISFTAETDQIKYTQEDLNIRRGAATLTFEHTLQNKSSTLSAEADLASVNWQNLPLRDVHATFDYSDGNNYIFALEGKTYGSEDLEWETNISEVGGVIKTKTTITPMIFSDLLSFLERNKRLKENVQFPGFVLNFQQPSISIDTVTNTENRMEGSFKFLNFDPSLELNGHFLSDDNNTIKGTFSAKNLSITSKNDAQMDNKNARFKATTFGEFIVDDILGIGTLGWSAKVTVDGGQIDYNALSIPNIVGEFSYDSKNPSKKREYLSFKLPLKPTVLQVGKIAVNIADREKPLLQTLSLDIYGGRIHTHTPIFDKGTIPKTNKLTVSDINLAQLFHDAGFTNIVISGRLGGIVPLKFDNKHINVNGGILQSQSKGIIKLPNYIIKGLFPGNSRKIQIIREALKNYHYDFFEIRLDGDLTGRIMMTLNASGYNPDFNKQEPVDLSLQIETQISLLFKNLLK